MFKQMTAGFALLLTVGIGCSGPTTEQLGGKSSQQISTGDNEFIKSIAISNQLELKTSEDALTQSQSSVIKNFAQHMIDDHTKAGSRLAELAAEKGVTLPTMLDPKHQSMIDSLNGQTGNEFDKAYINMQIAAHQEAIATDSYEANNGVDPQVKEFANSLLITLDMHLKMARDLQSN